MDSNFDVKALIKRLINEYAAFKISYGEVENETVFDDETGHYQLLYQGWIGTRRMHGCLLHIDLRDDKIWIQHDGTEYGFANELVEAGVPHDRIVLAYHHPTIRKHNGFASL